MKRLFLLTLVFLSIKSNAQKVSLGVRTGGTRWLHTNLYEYSVRNPGIGNQFSNDYEIFILYRTDKRFAVEAGNGLTNRKYKEYLRGNTWDIRHNIYEIHYSMMWSVLKLVNLNVYLGCDFALASDFRYEQLNGIKGKTTIQEYNMQFDVGHNCLIRYQLSKRMDIQAKLSYQFDTDKLWENKSPYANSRLMGLVGAGYTF